MKGSFGIDVKPTCHSWYFDTDCKLIGVTLVHRKPVILNCAPINIFKLTMDELTMCNMVLRVALNPQRNITSFCMLSGGFTSVSSLFRFNGVNLQLRQAVVYSKEELQGQSQFPASDRLRRWYSSSLYAGRGKNI